jgi:hypothetical protein
MTVADTILHQFGGGRALAMIGGKASTVDDTSLTVKFKARARNKSTCVLIAYDDGADLYTVTFWRIRGADSGVVKRYEGIYADQLQELFERDTGLFLRLTRGAQ